MSAFAATVRRGGGWLPTIGLLSVIDAGGQLALPAALGRCVDAIVAGGGAAPWVAAVAGLVALSVVADVLDAYAGAACVTRTTAWLRNRLVRHTLAAGPAGTRRFDAGDLVSRICANSADAAQAGPAVVVVGTALIPPVGSLVLLALIDPWVAVAFVAGLALVAGVLRAFARTTARITGAYQQVQGRIAARLAESLVGARTIAAAGTRDAEERRVLAPLGELRAHGERTWRALSRSSAQAAVVGPLVLIAVLTAGGLGVLAGRITPGELFAASRYAVIGAGLGALTGSLGRLARARAGIARAAEVLAVEPLRYGTRALPDRAAGGLLELRDVTVRAGANRLLDGVTLTVPAGALVAVVGRSGAGKSTLAAVAARLRDPDSGVVLLDGVPLAELSHDALRAAVGCAFERPALVGHTVADAVGVGKNPDLVRAAARATHAHDFVSRLPDGYATPLAETPLSGGERQRLGLARAWPADRLLVLDDATSSVDMVTEMRIAEALAAGRGRRTAVVVTHRVAAAARADLVVWLVAGSARAVAPHAALWPDPDYRAVFS